MGEEKEEGEEEDLAEELEGSEETDGHGDGWPGQELEGLELSEELDGDEEEEEEESGVDYENSDEEYPDSNVEETIPDEVSSFEYGGSDSMDSGSFQDKEDNNEAGTDYADDGEEIKEEEEEAIEEEGEAGEETKTPVEEVQYARKTFHQAHIMPKHMLSSLKNGGVSSYMTAKEHCTTEKQCPRIQFFCDGGGTCEAKPDCSKEEDGRCNCQLSVKCKEDEEGGE